jgi:16S rRNA (guanine966-N2)-methyltransferase
LTRIIGGTAKGRTLQTPPGDGTRPTSDRVREALFSSLEAQLGSLHGLRVLDLYAGSGAVGLEAASRGASAVTAVESDRRTATVVTANAVALGLPVAVVAQPVAKALAVPPTVPYDVAFLDPPYPMGDTEVVEALGLLVTRGWLSDGAAVVLERSARSVEPAWPAGLGPLPGKRSSKRYGDTVLWYLRRAHHDEALIEERPTTTD